MKFLIVAAIIAVAAANSAYPEPKYPAAPVYSAKAAYPAPYQQETYAPQPYSFAWEVNDAPSYNNYGHSESSDGNVVTGSYRVVLPDGRTQIVTYRADSNGYVANVKYEGEAKYPEYKAASYPAPSYKAPAPSYPAPAPSYPAPAPSYPAPAPSYPTPAPSYPTPAPSYPTRGPTYPKF